MLLLLLVFEFKGLIGVNLCNDKLFNDAKFVADDDFIFPDMEDNEFELALNILLLGFKWF